MTSHTLTLSGTATDNIGVKEVRVSLRDADTAKYANDSGGTQPGYTYFTVPVVNNPVPDQRHLVARRSRCPPTGDWNVTAVAVDTADQYDFSNTGATARYLVYPGDVPPTFNLTLLAPSDRQHLQQRQDLRQRPRRGHQPGRDGRDGQGRGGRPELDEQPVHERVRGFHTSATPTWITTFLTSPGTPGSNFSYTTPIIPAGTYTVLVPRHRPARPGDDRTTVEDRPRGDPAGEHQAGGGHRRPGVHEQRVPVRRSALHRRERRPR